MKLFTNLFFAMLCANYCFAQNDFDTRIGINGTSIDTLYTDFEGGHWEAQGSKIAAVQYTDMRKGRISIKIFDFDTQKPLGTARLKLMKSQERAFFLFDNNYTFVDKTNNTKTVTTEKGKKRTLYNLIVLTRKCRILLNKIILKFK